jgi:hypothetical protein
MPSTRRTSRNKSNSASVGPKTTVGLAGIRSRRIRLSATDQLAFAISLIDPPKPNAVLRRAAKAKVKLIKDKA